VEKLKLAKNVFTKFLKLRDDPSGWKTFQPPSARIVASPSLVATRRKKFDKWSMAKPNP
jgi:hypothetical protein